MGKWMKMIGEYIPTLQHFSTAYVTYTFSQSDVCHDFVAIHRGVQCKEE